MRTGTIRQTVLLPAPPKAVYDALMTAKGHAGFSGAPARISPKVGTAFTLWGGYIHGKNLELVPGKKIVQSWRPSEETWPQDYYSTVSYTLSPAKGGTRVTFVHSGVLPDHVGHLSSGWKKSYWDPLTTYLAKRYPT
jgi:uncharacterized protein YndB with AHSA1/START domain